MPRRPPRSPATYQQQQPPPYQPCHTSGVPAEGQYQPRPTYAPTDPIRSSNHHASYDSITIPNTTSRKKQIVCSYLSWIFGVFMVALLVFLLVHFTASYSALLSKQTELQRERKAWRHERESLAADVKSWHLEQEEHERELRAFEREREEWSRERVDHVAEVKAWQLQRKEHAAAVEAWQRVREEQDRERRVFEHEREEWEHQRRAHMPFWDPAVLDSTSCLAYNTRRYKSRLWNVPLGGDWLQACTSTPIEIHGRQVQNPEKCDLLGRDEIIGYWKIDFDEAECQPRWGETWDKGCNGDGIHVIEAPLWGQRHGDNWEEMCKTTPAHLPGVSGDLGRPTHCENRGPKAGGMVGRWEFYDANCR